MGIIDRIFSRKKNLQTDSMLSGSGLIMGGTFSAFGQKDKVLQMLENCGISDYNDPNPRSQVRLSRTMYDIFPFAKRAINDMASMVGNVVLVPGDNTRISDEVAREITELLQDLPLLAEWDWINPHEKGANNAAFRLARTMLLDGMCFEEDRYEDGMLNKYQGALIFNSLNFDFVKEKPGPYRLKYLNNQYPDLLPLYAETFNYTGYDYKNAHPWASPLLSGGGFFTHLLTAMLIAVKNINIRKGAPIDVNVIGIKDDKALMSVETRDAYIKTLSELENEMTKAVKKQLDGIPTSMVSKYPMNIELLQKSFGTDALAEINPNLLSLVLVAFANLLEVPIEFLGIVVGSAGFSPERFNKLYNIWGTKIDNIREKLKPLLSRIIDNYLRSQGVAPAIIEGLVIKFENAEIRDEKELSEIDKTKAETNKIHMEVAQGLAAVDTIAARDYLDRYNIITGE